MLLFHSPWQKSEVNENALNTGSGENLVSGVAQKAGICLAQAVDTYTLQLLVRRPLRYSQRDRRCAIIQGCCTRLQMEVDNKSADKMRTTHALHTYYRVSDIDNVSVSHLGSTEYLDNADERKAKSHAEAAARIDGVSLVDRIYKTQGVVRSFRAHQPRCISKPLDRRV